MAFLIYNIVIFMFGEAQELLTRDAANGRGTAASEKKRRVLVVDDETGIRKILGEMIKCQGYDVEAAVDGQDGLDKYTESLAEGRQPIDIIFSDMVMPRMGGDEFLRRIKSLQDSDRISKLPYFVGMSGYDLEVQDYEARRAAYSGSAISFMGKPFKLVKIKEELARAEAYLAAA